MKTIHRETKQRQIVLQELKKLHSHPSAKELHEIIKTNFPEIGLATVYRNLKLLNEQGIIIRLKTKSKEKESRYDAKIEKHCHLICRNCGKVEDICDYQGLTVKSDQIKNSNFKLFTDYIELPGLCQKCNI